MVPFKPVRAEFEKIITNEQQSFCWRRLRCKQFGGSYHYHPEYELFCVLKGWGRRWVGESIDHFGPDDLVLIAPNVPHFWQVAPECPKAEVLYIQFLPNFPGSEFFNLPELKTVCDLLNAAHCGMTFGASIRKQVSSQLNEFPALNKPERLFAFLETLYRLSQDVDIRPLGKAKNPVRLNRRDEERISKVFQYLNHNLTASISQAEIAANVRLSSAAFSRLFKKTTGKCFMEVVNELRIAQVCRLLAETDRNISEIAYECGFESLSNFHSQFRTVMKMPPRKYRERIAAIAPGMRGRCYGGLR